MVRAFGPSHAGLSRATPRRVKRFLEWEVKPLGTPFDGSDLRRSALGRPLEGRAVFDELVTGLIARSEPL